MVYATMQRDRSILVKIRSSDPDAPYDQEISVHVRLTGEEAALLLGSLYDALAKRHRSLVRLERRTRKVQAARRAHAEAVREQRKGEPAVMPP